MKTKNLQAKGHGAAKKIREGHAFELLDQTDISVMEQAEAMVKDSTLPANIREMAESVVFYIRDVEEFVFKDKHYDQTINAGIRAGLVWATIHQAMTIHGPGRGKSNHWRDAEKIFIEQHRAGEKMTETKLWALCHKARILPPTLSRETFVRTYKRKVKGWRELSRT